MLYVFYGPDQFRAREALRELRDGLANVDGNLANNTVRLEARGLTPGELRAACHAASFFVEARLVIVEGLQARFSGARRRGRTAARPRANAANELDAFVDVLTTLPESTTVVLLDESPSAAFLEAVEASGSLREFAVLRQQGVRPWTADRARAQGARFSNAALDRLAGLFDGHHLGELATEIDKLATYAGTRQVEVDDVDELVSGAIDQEIWDLTDAVIAGRADRALAYVEAKAYRGGRDYAPQYMTFMLVRLYRQLILAQALMREGAGTAEIGRQLEIRSDFALRKVIDQASRSNADHLEASYRLLLAADVAVKTGLMDVDAALVLLIGELCELARPPRRPAGASRAR